MIAVAFNIAEWTDFIAPCWPKARWFRERPPPSPRSSPGKRSSDYDCLDICQEHAGSCPLKSKSDQCPEQAIAEGRPGEQPRNTPACSATGTTRFRNNPSAPRVLPRSPCRTRLGRALQTLRDRNQRPARRHAPVNRNDYGSSQFRPSSCGTGSGYFSLPMFSINWQ